jgi:hypothetical protein
MTEETSTDVQDEKNVPSNYYINPHEFYDEIVVYRAKYFAAKLRGDAKLPPIPNSIAEKLLLLARRVSMRPNFRNYPFREDMIMDGLEDCIRYFHTYDPERSRNAFSYFTFTLFRAYVGRIQDERKQRYIKYKAMKTLTPIDGAASFQEGDDEGMDIQTDNENIDDFIRKYETFLANKKNKASKKSSPEVDASLEFNGILDLVDFEETKGDENEDRTDQ